MLVQLLVLSCGRIVLGRGYFLSWFVVYAQKQFSEMYRHEVKSKQWPGITQKVKAFNVQNNVFHDGVLVQLRTGLALALMEMSAKLHTLLAPLTGKRRLVPTEREVGRVQDRSGRFTGEKISCPCREIQPLFLGLQPRIPVTMSTRLSQLKQ